MGVAAVLLFSAGALHHARFDVSQVSTLLLDWCTVFAPEQLPDVFAPPVMPWAAIGGCGAGGSGGGAGDGIRWTGNGVSGGMLDIELMNRYSFGQNFANATFSPRLSYKPVYTTTIGCNIPFMSKTGAVQFRSNQPEETRIVGGLGDLSFDVSRAVGAQGAFSVGMGITLPTGQYDIKRGADASAEFLPTSLQKGGGLFNGSFMLDYTRDVEDGIWLANVTFNYPFALSASGENDFLDTYFSALKDSTSNRRFYYRFKPYGENDLGAFTPPSASMSVTYAYRGFRHYVHSCTFLFATPLGVAWIPSEKVGQYAPRPDPDHKVWSGALVYGLEFSRPEFPIFIAVSFPFHDKTNKAGADEFDPAPFRQWDGPDFGDLLQQGTIAIGFKSTIF